MIRVRFTVKRMMVAIACVALVFGGLTCLQRKAENRVFVENRSGQPIATLRIDLGNGGRVASFEDFPNASVKSASFWIRGDDSFAVKGTLDDGTKLGGNFGYVTNGMYGVHPRFVILKGGTIDSSQ